MTSFGLARRISGAWRRAVSAAVHAVRLNAIVEENQFGRAVIRKTRGVHGVRIARLTNLYFRLAGIPIRYLLDLPTWRRREVDSFNLLNGAEFEAVARGLRSVRADKLPGRSLWESMSEGRLNRAMLAAAGSELRRAHGFWSDEFQDWWSHGDLSITNILYDAENDCARLIDFEMRHERSLSATERHLDDLLVVILDLAGVTADDQWLPFSLAFLRAYGNAEVIAQLPNKLFFPRGLARIWWTVRTNFGKPAQVRKRFRALREAIAALPLQPETDLRAPNKRRASIHCQTSNPGTPNASSRTRATSESAKATSPGTPSR